MKSNITQLEIACKASFNSQLSADELCDISQRLDQLTKIAYKQLVRENSKSTEKLKNDKIETLTQPNIN